MPEQSGVETDQYRRIVELIKLSPILMFVLFLIRPDVAMLSIAIGVLASAVVFYPDQVVAELDRIATSMAQDIPKIAEIEPLIKPAGFVVLASLVTLISSLAILFIVGFEDEIGPLEAAKDE